MFIHPAPSIRPTPLVLPLLCLALSSLACDNDGDETRIGPSAVSSSRAAYISRGATVEPAVLIAQPVPAAPCPAAFIAPVNLVLRGNGVTDLWLSRVQMQFVHRTGGPGAFAAFTSTDLTGRFGSTLIPLSGTRSFPFSFPFGCSGLPFGTLTVVAFVVDDFGRERRSSVEVTVSVP